MNRIWAIVSVNPKRENLESYFARQVRDLKQDGKTLV